MHHAQRAGRSPNGIGLSQSTISSAASDRDERQHGDHEKVYGRRRRRHDQRRTRTKARKKPRGQSDRWTADAGDCSATSNNNTRRTSPHEKKEKKNMIIIAPHGRSGDGVEKVLHGVRGHPVHQTAALRARLRGHRRKGRRFVPFVARFEREGLLTRNTPRQN